MLFVLNNIPREYGQILFEFAKRGISCEPLSGNS
jgi:hypothetical protein